MAKRASKRRRTAKADDSATPVKAEIEGQNSSPFPDFHGDHLAALDTEWQGWAEIESEPAFFNVMLRDMGVRGVSVREIYSLDEDVLNSLPRPVYGVIFLFRYKEDEEFVDLRHKAGSKVWFANQTVSNACASYALINIVNNLSDIELGPELKHFRSFTKDFTPALRGDALSNFEFVKRVHNSFTRRMDKLNGDLHMKNLVDASKQKSRKRKASDEEEDAAHHFIAFMPIDGVLWKMDGLENQPKSLGKVRSDDWLDHVKTDIASRMSRYGDDENGFAILGLVQEPLGPRVAELAVNVKALRGVHERMKVLNENEGAIQLNESVLTDADISYRLNSDDISQAKIPPAILDTIENGTHIELEQELNGLVAGQEQLRLAVKEEQQIQMGDDDKANRRRHDYGEAIHQWIRLLVQKGAVRELVESGA